jgi:WD40 repeat protein
MPPPDVEQRDLVFISYSHRDSVWLDRLQIFLKPYIRQNLKVWADPYIETGGKWRRNITEALSRTSVAVLLVSPEFIASDFIFREELPPLLAAADVNAIILVAIPISTADYKAGGLSDFQFAHPPNQPLDGMRTSQRNAAFVQIVKEIAKAAQRGAPNISATAVMLPQQMEAALTPVSPTGRTAVLHGVPSQRPNYLRRQEYLNQVKRAVLGGTERAVGITGTTSRIGLHGMGGIGKTVLAIDLVNDDEVRRAFPDGIFWLTLGQTIEPLRLQSELAGYMAGEPRAYATVNEARDQLRELFDAKACLLVLDDLWRPRDAEPLDVLGPRSRLLITTRDADLLVALGARELPLHVLSEQLALELLASWAGQDRAALPPVASEVAESCGHLPLALALAGARVQGGARWEEVLSALERGRLEFLDHPYGSVFSSLRLSTDALTETERDRYFELAVFPEDADIPIETVCTLWHHTGGMEPAVARDLLLRLHRRALLIRSDDGKRISFHDLQHDFLRLNIESLVDGHAALVDAYRAAAASGWATGPDDGYFFQYLPSHLSAADRLDEVKTLLCNYDWLDAKLRATNITGLLADYDLVADDPNLALIHQSLRLSIPALIRDHSQLPNQLLGRLRGAESPPVKALVAGAEKGPGRAWLYPRFASLTPPGGPLRQILVGHTLPVSAVAVLLDGRRAVSGSADKTLRLWDLSSGATLCTLRGHIGYITSVAVLPDGLRAFSGAEDRTLRLWDLTTGESLRTFEGHTDWVSAVAVLADGRRVLSSSGDKTLRLWDLASGATLRTFEGHTDAVGDVAVLADGNHALSGSFDKTLRLWDLASGATLRVLEGHTSGVGAVAMLPDGRRALSGSWDNTLRLWDLASGSTLRTLKGHTDSVNSVAVLADGRRALSGSSDNTLRLWDLATGETLRTLEVHADHVNAVAVLTDGSRALSASHDNTLRLSDLGSSTILHTLEGHTSRVCAAVVLPDGRRVLSGSRDKTIRLWDLASGACLRTLEGHTRPVIALAMLDDGRRALSASWDKTLRFWDLASGTTLRALKGYAEWVTALAVFDNGRHALIGLSDNTLQVWELATGKTLRALEGHTSWVTALAVLAEGRRALSGSEDNTLRLWDLASGETLRTLEGHTHRITSVAVPADGRRALSGSWDNTLRLWDLATGVTLRTLEGHTSSVSSVAVLADGSRALSGSDDNTLRLWNLTTGECLTEHIADAEIACVTFAKDNLIVAGSADGRIHILEIRER